MAESVPEPAARLNSRSETIHATGVVIDEAGVLIRGAPGAGKSTLARELVATALLQGRFARLVSDDRIRLWARHGRLVAQAVPATAGRMEARGVGLLNVAYEDRAVVRLLIELSTEEPSRLPEPEESVASLCGIMVSCIRARSGAPVVHLVLSRLRGVQASEGGRLVGP
jgi:serine kinase of HPr protein (carbohydrate metabolism regulator)